MIKVGDTVTIIGGMSRRGDTVTVDQVSENECTIIDAKGNKGIYALTDVESQSMSGWVELHKEEAGGYGKKTEAMEVAGGCLVRTFEWGDFNSESSVFVPNSHIFQGQVIPRPMFLITADGEPLRLAAIDRVYSLNAAGEDCVVYQIGGEGVEVQCASKAEALQRIDEFLILAGGVR